MKQLHALTQRLKNSSKSLLGVAALAALFISCGLLPTPVVADDATDIQQKIDATTAQIAQLEKEIAQYEGALSDIGAQKNTLQSAVNTLDLSRKKISTSISATQSQISKATLELTQLGGAITTKEKNIETSKATIAKSLRLQSQVGGTTLVELLLSGDSLADAWIEIDKLATLEAKLQEAIGTLVTTKQSLTVDFNSTQARQAKLVSLKKQLAAQKTVLDQTRSEQAAILAQTKNKESSYQTILAQKQKAQAEFQKQLDNYEASLKYTLDTTAIPKAGSGVLSFPLDPAFMTRCQSQKKIYGNLYCLTQYFGNTAFAKSGAYNGQGHNGIDFGSPVGTEVVAALAGTVIGTGNTDLQTGCYSYGKWVLVQHTNGLDTLYSHLSVIGVSKGDTVSTGQFLGYSGKTGYVTGPHLHFGLYVASQVKILRLGDVKVKTNCGNVYMPVAPTEAYLNPMSYL